MNDVSFTIFLALIPFILYQIYLYFYRKVDIKPSKNKSNLSSYTPSYFSSSDLDKMYQVINKVSLGCLVVSDSNGNMISSMIPVTIQKPKGKESLYGTIYGHISNKNDMIHLFGEKCLISFLGDHGYISPNFYGELSNKFVPTWNYELVQCKGIFEKIHDVDKEKLFDDLVHREESKVKLEKIWNKDKDIDQNIINPMKGMIEWFKIDILEIQGTFKMSQNRTKEIRENLIKNIEKSNQILAVSMKNN